MSADSKATIAAPRNQSIDTHLFGTSAFASPPQGLKFGCATFVEWQGMRPITIARRGSSSPIILREKKHRNGKKATRNITLCFVPAAASFSLFKASRVELGSWTLPSNNPHLLFICWVSTFKVIVVVVTVRYISLE
ncbi:hypothetical protein EYC80_007341 [Monilinia laxa]|uniref:Uncharacterized protein n=1 Tax=Monilinia laxa TaxID=61186 RepID=A0A5N6JUD0_MONLA|nr:hypothetical protein EYC80_007341 [Monilinia laxa]